jgi:hypothetical protein
MSGLLFGINLGIGTLKHSLEQEGNENNLRYTMPGNYFRFLKGFGIIHFFQFLWFPKSKIPLIPEFYAPGLLILPPRA